jgi:SAM-dependent methyltransferase
VTTADHRWTALSHLAERNKQAWDDLYGATSQPVWGRRPIGFLAEFLDHVTPGIGPGSRVLDAGAGDGRNVETLERTGARVVVCDASRHALRKLRDVVHAKVRCAQCDVSMLPYGDDVFDLVVMTDIIETLPDPEPALAEAHRVLAPGGMLLCNIPGDEDPIADRDMSEVDDEAFLYRGKYFFRFIEADQASAMMRRRGFVVIMAEARTWIEDPHPSFRAYAHEHISNVFLCRKA